MPARKPKITVVAERTEICKNCRWAEFADQEFRCHRYAPIGVYDGSYVWPLVASDDFFGDFSAKLDS